MSFISEESATLFYNTATILFINDGWELKEARSSSSCPTVSKGKQSLYLHPQSFSGIVATDNIETIEQLLSQAETFKHYNTDIYEQIYNLSDEEYQTYFESKAEEIKQDILSALTTKRKNLYVTTDICFTLAQKYSLKRTTGENYVFHSGRIELTFVNTLFQQLLVQKKIIAAKTKNGTGYRTVTPKLTRKTLENYQNLFLEIS